MRDNLTKREPLLREPEPEIVAAYGVVTSLVAFVVFVAVFFL